MADTFSRCADCGVAAGNLSLAYFGGLARSFLDLLAIFGGLTKIYSPAYFGGSAVQLGLVWWLGRLSGSLGWPSRLSLPFWLLRHLFSLDLLDLLDGALACDIDRKFGGFFDGPGGHAVLLLHPA